MTSFASGGLQNSAAVLSLFHSSSCAKHSGEDSAMYEVAVVSVNYPWKAADSFINMCRVIIVNVFHMVINVCKKQE